MSTAPPQDKRIHRLVISNIALSLVVVALSAVTCVSSLSSEVSRAMLQMNTDLQAIVYHLESPEEAEHRLRNYDKVERRTDNLNEHADLELTVRADVWHGWIQGSVQYKDSKPVSFIVVQVFPMP